MTKYEPLEIEKEVLEFWENNKMMEKADKKRENGPTFSFFDGPPTANNPIIPIDTKNKILYLLRDLISTISLNSLLILFSSGSKICRLEFL